MQAFRPLARMRFTIAAGTSEWRFAGELLRHRAWRRAASRTSPKIHSSRQCWRSRRHWVPACGLRDGVLDVGYWNNGRFMCIARK